MKSFLLLPLLFAPLVAGCNSSQTQSNASPAGATSVAAAASAQTLRQARQGFKTRLAAQNSEKTPVEIAPSKVFRTIKYPAPGGQLAAYVSPDPRNGNKKNPAIIWITGGDCNTIGDVWSSAPRQNDQTAAAFRRAGIVMMFPSLRGGNNNPGQKEGFLGEVDDVLAAAKYLEKQPYVDAKRIYLGGHSTGGTLALLVAECSPRFRATFSFGPVGDVSGYGEDSGFLPFDLTNEREVEMRSPGYWLASVRSPVWVFEGSEGNIDSLRAMAEISKNPQAHFIELKGFDHFSILAPLNELLARKILADKGTKSNLSVSQGDISRLGR